MGAQDLSLTLLLQVLANMKVLSLTPPKLTAKIKGMREVTLGVFPTYFPFAGMETDPPDLVSLHPSSFPTYFPFAGMETLRRSLVRYFPS